MTPSAEGKDKRLRVRIHWDAGGGRSGVFTTDDNLDLHENPEYESPYDIPRGWNTYIWEEGNFSCDCNRARFFLNEEWPCGERIEIVKMEPA